MTRKIKIGTINYEVSKNEAKEAAIIAEIKKYAPDGIASATHRFQQWRDGAPTVEARRRREAVGEALGLFKPAITQQVK